MHDEEHDELQEVQELAERAGQMGPLLGHPSPLTPGEMITAIAAMPESELPPAARHELVRLVECEEARVYRNGISGTWIVWQELIWEQVERNEDSRKPLDQWVAEFLANNATPGSA